MNLSDRVWQDDLMDEDNWREELQKYADAHQITDYPDNFKSWVSDNADNIAAARARGTEPYFVRNNADVIDNILNPAGKPVAKTQGLPQNAHDFIEHLRKNGNPDESYKDSVVLESHKLSETSKIEKGLNAARKSLIRQNREVMMILDKSGNPIKSVSGATRSVYFDDETAAMAKNRVVTHNHPTGKNATGAQSFGYSLSLDDLLEAFKCDMRGMVAESPKYRYAIERPANGWNIDLNKFRADYEKISLEIITDYADILNRHNGANLVQHLVLKRLSKQYDFIYYHTRL